MLALDLGVFQSPRRATSLAEPYQRVGAAFAFCGRTDARPLSAQHEHLFEAGEDGTLCHDIVEYAEYGGPMINTLFVRPDLSKIFAFRHSKLRELFPGTGTSTLQLNWV